MHESGRKETSHRRVVKQSADVHTTATTAVILCLFKLSGAETTARRWLPTMGPNSCRRPIVCQHPSVNDERSQPPRNQLPLLENFFIMFPQHPPVNMPFPYLLQRHLSFLTPAGARSQERRTVITTSGSPGRVGLGNDGRGVTV